MVRTCYVGEAHDVSEYRTIEENPMKKRKNDTSSEDLPMTRRFVDCLTFAEKHQSSKLDMRAPTHVEEQLDGVIKLSRQRFKAERSYDRAEKKVDE